MQLAIARPVQLDKSTRCVNKTLCVADLLQGDARAVPGMVFDWHVACKGGYAPQ
jgi:hypothetical protein